MQHPRTLLVVLVLSALAPLQLAAQMAASILPFELANNLILVEAEVDGRKGLFFFDSGAPRLGLNSARWPERTAATTPGMTNAGATGTHTGRQTTVAKFSLGHVVQENVTAGFLDLSHLERATGREVLGLIGYENIRDQLVCFDYAAKQVKLLPSIALGHLPAPVASIPFTMERHVPIFAALLSDGTSLKLGLDCGAGGGMLDANLREQLKPLLRADGAQPVAGAGGTTSGGMERFRGELKLADTVFKDVAFMFMPMGHFRAQGATFDGVVGYHLLSARPSAIDYANSRLLFW
ncbi:MAG: hypothetical protein C0518_15530 [Opitutus sp.]|nr:hypothetical protein [Opitutus sp.]